MREIANTNLTEKDIPPPGAQYWGLIDRFALSFDGYKYWGTFEKCAEISNNRINAWHEAKTLPASLTELRTCLFMQQRAWKHLEEHPDEKAMIYIRALVEAIRNKVQKNELE